MTEHEADETTVPTKEWLKRQRKHAYERAKQDRKQKRRELKATKQKERESQRSERDQDLWRMLRPASEQHEPQQSQPSTHDKNDRQF